MCLCRALLQLKQRIYAACVAAGNKDGLLLQQEVGCAEATVQLLQEAAMTGAWGAAVRQPDSAENMQQDGEPSPAAKMHQQQDHQALDARAGSSCDQQQQEQLAASNPPGVLCNAAGGNSGRSLSVPLDHKGLMLPAGPEGWLVIDDTNQLEQLLQCLEQRGVRERDLKTCLDKVGETEVLSSSRPARAPEVAGVPTCHICVGHDRLVTKPIGCTMIK